MTKLNEYLDGIKSEISTYDNEIAKLNIEIGNIEKKKAEALKVLGEFIKAEMPPIETPKTKGKGQVKKAGSKMVEAIKTKLEKGKSYTIEKIAKLTGKSANTLTQYKTDLLASKVLVEAGKEGDKKTYSLS